MQGLRHVLRAALVCSLVCLAPVGALGADSGGPCNGPKDTAPFQPIADVLKASDIGFLGFCRSHLEGTFTSTHTAFVRTEHGPFEIIVFEGEREAEKLRVTYETSEQQGQVWYRETLAGVPTFRTPIVMEGTQRPLFVSYRNLLIVTYDTALEKRLREALYAFYGKSDCK